jgi:hypothetical protein
LPTILSLVLGAVFGYASEALAGVLTKKEMAPNLSGATE